MPASSKHSMQEPTVRLCTLTEYPQLYAVDVEYRVVIAPDVTSIPPTCLDPLNVTEKAQRAAAARHASNFLELLWRLQKPKGTAEGRPGRRRHGLGLCRSGLCRARFRAAHRVRAVG